MTANDSVKGKGILSSYKSMFLLWYAKYKIDSTKRNEFMYFFNINNAMHKIAFDTVRPIIFSRDLFICMICGQTITKMNMLNVDHIIPKSKFPSSHPWNLQTLCIPCNKDKSNELYNEIPVFLKGAKIRTTKFFSDNYLVDIKVLLNFVYETNSFGEEKIIDEIINNYNNWENIKLYLQKSVKK